MEDASDDTTACKFKNFTYKFNMNILRILQHFFSFLGHTIIIQYLLVTQNLSFLPHPQMDDQVDLSVGGSQNEQT